MTRTQSRPGNTRMRAYRERLRRLGLRPVQVWLPDVRGRRFAAEAHRQSQLASRHRSEREVIDHIEQAADLAGWKA